MAASSRRGARSLQAVVSSSSLASLGMVRTRTSMSVSSFACGGCSVGHRALTLRREAETRDASFWYSCLRYDRYSDVYYSNVYRVESPSGTPARVHGHGCAQQVRARSCVVSARVRTCIFLVFCWCPCTRHGGRKRVRNARLLVVCSKGAQARACLLWGPRCAAAAPHIVCGARCAHTSSSHDGACG